MMLRLFSENNPTIDLTAHAKIWVGVDGIIPTKIMNRLLLQREVRPDDTLSLFVNALCVDKSTDQLEKLKEAGIHIILIEEALAQSQDDPYLINMVNAILRHCEKTKKIKEYIFAIDLLRMMHVVQDKGLYSDMDVFFLKSDCKSLSIPYLLGDHPDAPQLGPDTNIFGTSPSSIKKLHLEIIKAFKNHQKVYELSTEDMNTEKIMCLQQTPGILYLPDDFVDSIKTCSISNHKEAANNIIYHIEDRSWMDNSSGRDILFSIDEDLLINEVKNKSQIIMVLV